MTAHASHTPADGDLYEIAEACAEAVSRLTALMIRWVGAVAVLGAQRIVDIELAVYEALANCADHAYLDRALPGKMTLRANYDQQRSVLRFCVTDEGQWVDPNSAPQNDRTRGRGMLLMRELADDLTVDGREDGTTVCLQFFECAAA